MTATSTRARVRTRGVDQEIARLQTIVSRMESRYEVSSSEAMDAVRSGTMKETAEVAKWLISYRALTSLKEARERGAAGGSLTTST